MKRVVKEHRNDTGRASGRTLGSRGRAAPVPPALLFPGRNSPSALAHHEVSHVQAGTAAAPQDVVAPAAAPQTQNVVQTMEKQLSDRDTSSAMQGSSCLQTGPSPPFVPAAMPIQVHFEQSPLKYQHLLQRYETSFSTIKAQLLAYPSLEIQPAAPLPLPIRTAEAESTVLPRCRQIGGFSRFCLASGCTVVL